MPQTVRCGILQLKGRGHPLCEENSTLSCRQPFQRDPRKQWPVVKLYTIKKKTLHPTSPQQDTLVIMYSSNFTEPTPQTVGYGILQFKGRSRPPVKENSRLSCRQPFQRDATEAVARGEIAHNQKRKLFTSLTTQDTMLTTPYEVFAFASVYPEKIRKLRATRAYLYIGI
jgi:hypothetical protein